MKDHQYNALCVVILAVSSLTPAFSQDNTHSTENTGKKMLSAGIGFPDTQHAIQSSIGLGIGPFPEYEGADDYAASAFPLIEIRKPGSYFIKGAGINLNNGLASAGVTLIHVSYTDGSARSAQFVMGPLLRAYAGRDEDDSNILYGLGNIDKSAGIGVFLEFSAGPWLANIAASPQDAGNDKDGHLVTLDVEYTTAVNSDLEITTGIAASWADDDYMQAYFGITDAQAVRSGLPRSDSKAGFKDVGVQLKASFALSSRWSLEGQVGYWRLMNDAADSPIVKEQGSANQVRGLVGFLYQF